MKYQSDTWQRSGGHTPVMTHGLGRVFREHRPSRNFQSNSWLIIARHRSVIMKPRVNMSTQASELAPPICWKMIRPLFLCFKELSIFHKITKTEPLERRKKKKNCSARLKFSLHQKSIPSCKNPQKKKKKS